MRLATVNSFPISSNNHWWRGNDSNDNLPNCCDKKDAWQIYAICKHTPANQFRFVGPMNFTIENRPTSIDFHKAIDRRIIGRHHYHYYHYHYYHCHYHYHYYHNSYYW